MKGSNSNAKKRSGAVRKGNRGRQVGSGGQGRQALEGRGPTPKAEDRPYHPAGKRKAAAERKRPVSGQGSPRQRTARPSRGKTGDGELVTGRNAVLEALRARIPASGLTLATRIEFDDRVREIVHIANGRGIPIVEVMRPELDRMSGPDGIHQGVALAVPPYEYAHPSDLVDSAEAAGQAPLLVVLDGVTDPRNLGAIIRSTAAFGGHGVVVPQRRSVGMTAAAWRTSAGAAARTPVALVGNLTQALKDLKARGLFVLGLDGDGDVALPELSLAAEPLALVVGSEGKGLSRLAAETCDAIVSIPIAAATESLNAGIAASVALYQVSVTRGAEH